MNSSVYRRCEDCIHAKERHMPGKVYCEKHNEFVERAQIPTCYGCTYFTNMNEEGEDK